MFNPPRAAAAVIFFWLISLFSTTTCIANVECLEDQRSWLLQLKKEFNVSSEKLISWQPGTNCCNWDGITCDAESGKVIVLELGARNISGRIGASLFNLNSLQTLNLAYNRFDSINIPSALQRLVNLTRLNLSNAGFVGEIPVGISKLTELESLDLSTNCGDVIRLEISDLQVLVRKHGNLKELYLDCVSMSNTSEWYKVAASLPRLQVLSLNNCNLSGDINVPLFRRPALQEIYLNHNQLTGKLLELQIASSSLRAIDLSNNQLQGQIPKSLFKLSGLQHLGLASNNFTGGLVLDSFYTLSNLTYLDLSNNKLTIRNGDGDGKFSLSFPKISTLKLASCNLVNMPSILRHQDRMTNLDLSNNKIAGDIPKWIWGIGNRTLMSMNLSYNMFAKVEDFVHDFSYNLEFSPIILDLNSNNLQGPIPLPPRNTILIDYSNNNFYSIIPFNVSYYLNSTIFFSLANNSLIGNIPQTICNATSLQVIDLSDNYLSGSVPSCILEHKNNLIVLNLRGNKLEGKIPHIISKECGLKTLNFNSNNLGGGVPFSLVNCNNLEVIDFGNNHLVDIFPYWLGSIYVLQILVLRSNGFYGSMALPPEIPHNNYTFIKLQILDLSSNKFSGNLPIDCFPNLKAMIVKSQPNISIVGEFVQPQLKLLFEGIFYQDTVIVTSKGRETELVKILTIYNYLDFSNNNFDGEIPAILGALQSLCVLNLSHNALTGRIPTTFGNLTQLESLDLSSNHLSGEIPQELTSLTFLSFLKLSNNNLSGRIPTGNQFSTFTNASYQGNRGLCGSPLSRRCINTSPESTLTEAPVSKSDFEIELALAIGIGYGFGIGLVFVMQTVPVKEWWLLVQRSWHDKVSRPGGMSLGNGVSKGVILLSQ